MVWEQMDVHTRKNEAGPLPHTADKLTSKQIKALNVRAKTVQLLS